MKKIGFIDYYLKEWHADNYPSWIKQASNGEMEVAYAYGLIDSPHGTQTNKDWALEHNIELCQSIEEVIEKSDYLIVLSPDNSEMHWELCQLPLRSKKPTFVDKTFAPTAKIAQDLITLAKENGTPLFSSSALRFSNELSGIDKDKIDYISSIGSGKLQIYLIHQVEPIIKLMGTDVERVLCTGTDITPAFSVQFKSGKTASITMLCDAPFAMDINYNDGKTNRILEMTNFFPNFMVDLVRFFKEEKSSFCSCETLAVINTIEKCIEASKNKGTWIFF